MKHKLLGAGALLAAMLVFSAGLSGCKPKVHDHVFGDWVAATENHYRECEICQFREEQPHEYTDDWIQGPESHWRECEICHVKFAEAGHFYQNVVGASATLYAGDNRLRPIISLSAPEGDQRELYIKEVWACIDPTPGRLRVSCSTTTGGTFGNSIEILATEGGWLKGTFQGDGMRLAVFSYARLEAVTMNLVVKEVVFLANDAKNEGETVLLQAKLADTDGTDRINHRGLLDYQQFPGEFRACYACNYPEPKTQE